MKRRSLTMLLLLLLVSGCGSGENSNLKAELAEITKDVKGRVEPIPEIKPYEPFPYAATGLPDPFKPALIKVPMTGVPGAFDSEISRVKEPLEAFPLESIKMVGTLSRPSDGMVALVTSDAGLSKVTVGKYLGQNFGKIKAITATHIELREIFQDSAGDWAERTAILQMEEKEGRK